MGHARPQIVAHLAQAPQMAWPGVWPGAAFRHQSKDSFKQRIGRKAVHRGKRRLAIKGQRRSSTNFAR
jgi:hypothetical protein